MGSAACEPTWNDNPRTGIAEFAGQARELEQVFGITAEFARQIDDGARRPERHAQEQLCLVAVTLELAHFVGVVGDERLHAEVQRIADIDVALDGMRMDAARRVDAELRDELGFTGGGEVQPATELDDGLDHRRMRQRLERVVQVDAGQRPMQLAVLLAHPLAVDDEQGRAELRHEPADLGGGERVDVCALRA